ncbi:MAG: hypothetical protein ACPGPS_15010, partial [Rubripirellula sp.]
PAVWPGLERLHGHRHGLLGPRHGWRGIDALSTICVSSCITWRQRRFLLEGEDRAVWSGPDWQFILSLLVLQWQPGGQTRHEGKSLAPSQVDW